MSSAPQERLRLLVIGSLPPPLGGTGVSLRQLVRELAERTDIDLEVIDTSRGEAGGPRALLRAAGRLFRRAPAAIRRADVVTFHASTPGTVLFGPPLVLLARLLRRPLVLREFGGSLDAEYQEMGALRRAAVRAALRADRVLLQTHALVESFARRVPAERLRWYSNSRPLPGAPPAPPPGAASGARRFVYVGQLRPTKGIHEILEAAASLEGFDFRVEVFGPLQDGFSERTFAGSRHVRYLGVLAPEEVLPTLATFDAVLLPTYHLGEGYPGTLLEAYAAGRPVIASRWRAIPEIVEHDVTGLLVPPRDPTALAEAMKTLIVDPARLARLARGATMRATEYDSVHWTGALVDICRELAR